MITLQKFKNIKYIDMLIDVLGIIKDLWLQSETIIILPPTESEWLKNKKNWFNLRVQNYTNNLNISFQRKCGYDIFQYYFNNLPTQFTDIEEHITYKINEDLYLKVILPSHIHFNQLYYNKKLFNNYIANEIVPFYFFN